MQPSLLSLDVTSFSSITTRLNQEHSTLMNSGIYSLYGRTKDSVDIGYIVNRIWRKWFVCGVIAFLEYSFYSSYVINMI